MPNETIARLNPVREDGAYLAEMAPERLETFMAELEDVAFKLSSVVSRRHEMFQTRWLGGDSSDERNHSMPSDRVQVIGAALNLARESIAQASHELTMEFIASARAADGVR